MKLAELEKKLLSVARRNTPDPGVPAGFQHRVMARLVSAPVLDEWVCWIRALWIGAGACACVAAVAIFWAAAATRDNDSICRFSVDLEQTILASADDGDNADLIW